MLSRFDSFLIRDIPFGFLLGGGAVFSNSLQLYFFQTKRKHLIFCSHKKVFLLLLLCLPSVSPSKCKSDQHPSKF